MAARVLLQRVRPRLLISIDTILLWKLTRSQRAVAPLAATLLAGGIGLYPAVAHAEAPADYRVSIPMISSVFFLGFVY
jgi:hypothetical protein